MECRLSGLVLACGQTDTAVRTDSQPAAVVCPGRCVGVRIPVRTDFPPVWRRSGAGLRAGMLPFRSFFLPLPASSGSFRASLFLLFFNIYKHLGAKCQLFFHIYKAFRLVSAWIEGTDICHIDGRKAESPCYLSVFRSKLLHRSGHRGGKRRDSDG